MTKKSKQSIVVVHLLKWQGIYVNGKLMAEGEKVNPNDFTKALKDIHYHYPGGLPTTNCQKYFNKHKCLPKKLIDTFEKIEGWFLNER